jgi:hypothetical protein
MSTFLFFSECEQLGWQFPLLHHACTFYSLLCFIRAITWCLLPKSAVMYKSIFGDVSIQWQTCLVRQEEQIHLTSTLRIITSIVFSCNCAPLNVLCVKIVILLGVWNLMSTIAGFFYRYYHKNIVSQEHLIHTQIGWYLHVRWGFMCHVHGIICFWDFYFRAPGSLVVLSFPQPLNFFSVFPFL